MNKLTLIAYLLLSALFICTGCDKEANDEAEESTKSPYIEGLSIDNYPVIDGSTSTLPLNTVIACELMGLHYQWLESPSLLWDITPQIQSENLKRKFNNVVRSSQTHNSFISLIDGEADLVLSARTMSPDEKKYAETKGVTLIETPVALDAFIFIIHPQNPIEALSTQAIQGIYTGKVTEWQELGWLPVWYGGRTNIQPFVRDPNSGSQELMDLLVMKDLVYFSGSLLVYADRQITSMIGLVNAIADMPISIGYTIYYYNEYIVRNGNNVKTLGIDGVQPTPQTISDRSYPYATDVYAVLRSDTDKSSMTYAIYAWLQTEAGRQVISKSGYLLN